MDYIWPASCKFLPQPKEKIDARNVRSRGKPNHLNSSHLSGDIIVDGCGRGHMWQGHLAEVRGHTVCSNQEDFIAHSGLFLRQAVLLVTKMRYVVGNHMDNSHLEP